MTFLRLSCSILSMQQISCEHKLSGVFFDLCSYGKFSKTYSLPEIIWDCELLSDLFGVFQNVSCHS